MFRTRYIGEDLQSPATVLFSTASRISSVSVAIEFIAELWYIRILRALRALPEGLESINSCPHTFIQGSRCFQDSRIKLVYSQPLPRPSIVSTANVSGERIKGSIQWGAVYISSPDAGVITCSCYILNQYRVRWVINHREVLNSCRGHEFHCLWRKT